VRPVSAAAAFSMTVRGRLVANFAPTEAASSVAGAPDHASVIGIATSRASFAPYAPLYHSAAVVGVRRNGAVNLAHAALSANGRLRISPNGYE
jgi:hypothetical protein